MKKRNNRFSTYVFAFMAILMLVSAILPGIQPQTPPVEPDATATPVVPTFPAPITEFQTISFEQEVLAPSGLFTIAQPTGWTALPTSNVGAQVGAPEAPGIQMENNAALSVIQAYIDMPVAPVENLQQLSDRFNQAVLESGWRNYNSAEEIGRRIDDQNQQVLIDFELTLNQQEYLARQVSWIGENGWIYAVRVVTPANARDLLFFLIENLPATIEPVELLADSPMGFTAYYSPAENHIIRYPRSWQLVDGGPGTPVTIQGPQNEFLNVRLDAGQSVGDEAAATSYVEGLRAGSTVKTVTPVERNGASGYAVSYGLSTLEGEPISGLAVLLNGEDGLHVASVRVPNVNVDYNQPVGEGQVEPEAVQILETFNLTTGLNLPVPQVTPTLVVTPAATEETETAATEEPTPEAVATEEAETTATEAIEPTAEATEE